MEGLRVGVNPSSISECLEQITRPTRFQQNSGPNRRDYALPVANDSRECTSPMGFELVYVET